MTSRHARPVRQVRNASTFVNRGIRVRVPRSTAGDNPHRRSLWGKLIHHSVLRWLFPSSLALVGLLTSILWIVAQEYIVSFYDRFDLTEAQVGISRTDILIRIIPYAFGSIIVIALAVLLLLSLLLLVFGLVQYALVPGAREVASLIQDGGVMRRIRGSWSGPAHRERSKRSTSARHRPFQRKSTLAHNLRSKSTGVELVPQADWAAATTVCVVLLVVGSGAAALLTTAKQSGYEDAKTVVTQSSPVEDISIWQETLEIHTFQSEAYWIGPADSDPFPKQSAKNRARRGDAVVVFGSSEGSTYFLNLADCRVHRVPTVDLRLRHSIVTYVGTTFRGAPPGSACKIKDSATR